MEGWIEMRWFPVQVAPTVQRPLEEEEINNKVWVGRGQGELQRAATVHQGEYIYIPSGAHGGFWQPGQGCLSRTLEWWAHHWCWKDTKLC